MSTITSLDAAALHLAAIVSSSDDAITSEDQAGIIQSWNRAAERIYGYTASEAIGTPMHVIIPEEHREQEALVLGRLRDGKPVEHFETVRIAKDGRRVLVSLTVSAIRTPAGEVVGFSSIARDVTNQKALERETYRLAAIVNFSEDAIISKSLDGTVLTWNRAAQEMFGYTADEVIGRSIRIIIPPDREAEEDDVLARVRAGVGVEHFETVRRRKDGTLIDISLTVSPVKSPDGTIIGASKIARNITEQKRLIRELEQASRMKDEFLATLSHELRTPLNAVLGYARMWRSGTVVEERREQVVQIIERNANSLAQLVSDVLDMSSIVTGKVRLFPESCDLSELVHAAVDVVRPSAEAKGLELQVVSNSASIMYRCDTNRMRQVFWNLLSNAVKFTPNGGRIEVQLAKEASHIEVTVSDTGIGIKPEFLPHVFQRFRQGEGGIARQFGGLGLGLALVQHFIELHGGTVTAMSRGEGQGATFRVMLPIVAGALR